MKLLSLLLATLFASNAFAQFTLIERKQVRPNEFVSSYLNEATSKLKFTRTINGVESLIGEILNQDRIKSGCNRIMLSPDKKQFHCKTYVTSKVVGIETGRIVTIPFDLFYPQWSSNSEYIIGDDYRNLEHPLAKLSFVKASDGNIAAAFDSYFHRKRKFFYSPDGKTASVDLYPSSFALTQKYCQNLWKKNDDDYDRECPVLISFDKAPNIILSKFSSKYGLQEYSNDNKFFFFRTSPQEVGVETLAYIDLTDMNIRDLKTYEKVPSQARDIERTDT